MPGVVHVWHASPSAFDAPEARRRCAELLDGKELARLDRYRVELDRSAYLVTHALLRSALHVHTGVDPRHWRFAPGPAGKPGVLAPSAFRSVSFNVSHSRRRTCVAVALHGEVGIDVEDATRGGNLEALWSHSLSPGEALSLKAAPAEARRSRFLTLWTLKEAFLKAKGVGLSLPLTSSRFDVDGDSIRVSFDPETLDDPEAWAFARLNLDSDHTAALASRRVPGESLRVYVREATDLPSS